MKTNPNESAYVVPPFQGPSEISWGSNGLTKREHFAAMAMQGLCGNRSAIDHGNAAEIEWTARVSCSLADALIAELNKAAE